LILDNQLKIRLLGIKEIFEKRNEAIAFLNEKIYKQKYLLNMIILNMMKMISTCYYFKMVIV